MHWMNLIDNFTKKQKLHTIDESIKKINLFYILNT